MKVYKSGNAIVDAVGQMRFSGNIIPESWYKNLVYENGKPHLNAINLLAEFVFWYRPIEHRDEETGNVQYKKKFADEYYLQKNYDQLSEKFGLSRKQVKTAVIFLENQGLIKRHVKPVTLGTGRTINNVMFIELIPDQLSKITFDYDDQEINSWVPESTCTHPSRDPYGSLKVPTWVPESTHVGPSKHPCGSLEGRTYTKTTTKTTTEIPSNHSETCMENYRMVEERIREQIDVKSLYAVFPGYKETIDAIVTIIANLFTTQEKEIRIGNEKQSIEVVRAQMNKLNYSMVEVLINSLRGNTKRIIRPDRYLIKCIYNATLYSELMIENEVILDRFNGS